MPCSGEAIRQERQGRGKTALYEAIGKDFRQQDENVTLAFILGRDDPAQKTLLQHRQGLHARRIHREPRLSRNIQKMNGVREGPFRSIERRAEADREQAVGRFCLRAVWQTVMADEAADAPQRQPFTAAEIGQGKRQPCHGDNSESAGPDSS